MKSSHLKLAKEIVSRINFIGETSSTVCSNSFDSLKSLEKAIVKALFQVREETLEEASEVAQNSWSESDTDKLSWSNGIDIAKAIRQIR